MASMGLWAKLVGFLLLLMLGASFVIGEDSTKVKIKLETDAEKRILGKVKTIYTVKGRPTQRSQFGKGWHQIADSWKLVAGRAIVSLNTSTSQNRQDVSFLSKETYRGTAFSLDTLNSRTYKIIPLSGAQFLIMSSDSTDTATVNFLVEGE